jgi:hypothetical protein
MPDPTQSGSNEPKPQREVTMMLPAIAFAVGLSMNAPVAANLAARSDSAHEARAEEDSPSFNLGSLHGKVWSKFGVNFCFGEPKDGTHCHFKYRLPGSPPPPPSPTSGFKFSVFGKDVCLGPIADAEACAIHLPFEPPTDEEATKTGGV